MGEIIPKLYTADLCTGQSNKASPPQQVKTQNSIPKTICEALDINQFCSHKGCRGDATPGLNVPTGASQTLELPPLHFSFSIASRSSQLWSV